MAVFAKKTFAIFRHAHQNQVIHSARIPGEALSKFRPLPAQQTTENH